MTNKNRITEIVQQLQESNTQKVKLAVADIDGVLRGKLMSFDKFKTIAAKGFGFCDVVMGWDVADSAYDNSQFTGWHTGYPDATALIDINTLRRIPWEMDIPFFLADLSDKQGAPLDICPRNLLKKIIQQSEALGLSPYFSQEFEWFNFKKHATEVATTAPSPHQHLTTGMFGYSLLRSSQQQEYFHDLFDLLTRFDVPIEGLHTETGPGVYEAAIVYGPVLAAADRAVCFKMGVKEIASRHNIIASFMAKFNGSLPGCSGHIHQSLWTTDQQQNLFYADNATGISEMMEHYIAGQLFCLPHILPMFAPTVNSYKRLTEGAWAPTTVTWGIDNRTTALRALPAGANSTRLETRVVGSDANPYLAMAGCLAAGLYGIKNKLALQVDATNGNGYTDKKNGVLAATLWDATQLMKNSTLATELFGKAFVDHFTGTREWEWRQFSKSVTDWELQRYFEII